MHQNPVTVRSTTKSGAEVDVVYARHIYCFTRRAGVCASVKRQMRRRLRHELRRVVD